MKLFIGIIIGITISAAAADVRETMVVKDGTGGYRLFAVQMDGNGTYRYECAK